jgi:hypothetical protein
VFRDMPGVFWAGGGLLYAAVSSERGAMCFLSSKMCHLLVCGYYCADCIGTIDHFCDMHQLIASEEQIMELFEIPIAAVWELQQRKRSPNPPLFFSLDFSFLCFVRICIQ